MSGFAPQKYKHFALFDEVFEKLGEGFPCVSYSRFDCLRIRAPDFQIILKPCGFDECSTNDQVKYPHIGDRLPAALALLTPRMDLVTTRGFFH